MSRKKRVSGGIVETKKILAELQSCLTAMADASARDDRDVVLAFLDAIGTKIATIRRGTVEVAP